MNAWSSSPHFWNRGTDKILAASWENQQCGFRTGLTQTGLYKHRRWLETGNFGFRKKRNCTIRIAKTKALISFAVTAKLICVFVFAYADCWFSHEAAHMYLKIIRNNFCLFVVFRFSQNICSMKKLQNVFFNDHQTCINCFSVKSKLWGLTVFHFSLFPFKEHAVIWVKYHLAKTLIHLAKFHTSFGQIINLHMAK